MHPEEFLATVEGFRDIEPAGLRNIAKQVQVRTFEPGAHIIRRGHPGDCMYVVMSGRVRVPVTDERRGKKMVFYLEQGNLLGEMALLTGEPRRADMIAETAGAASCLASAYYAENLDKTWLNCQNPR